MHQIKRGMLGILAVLMGLGWSNAWGENAGFVRRQGTRLELNGQTFYFGHANQYYLFYKSQAMIDEVLADASGLGLRVMRTWASSEGVWNNGYCFQPSAGVYDENTLRKLDYIVFKANQSGIRLILPLVDNWSSFGGMDKYVEWSPTANSHDQFYTDPACKQWFKNYVGMLLNRVNTYTGIAYKNDPTIMMWELANEPRCQSDPTGNTLHSWIDEMAAHIKSIDSNHLISTGSEGWYKRSGTTDWKYNGFEGADYIRNHQSPWIDVCSFHLYPNDWDMNEAGAITWIQEHVSDAHNVIGKPVVGGEFGWRVDRSQASGSQTLAHFSTGIDGFTIDWGFTSISRAGSPSYDGNGSLSCRINLRSSTPNGGIRKNLASPQNYSAAQSLSAWVYLPGGSPSNLRAEFYVKSTGSMSWADGDDVTLIPGGWVQVRITPAQIAAWGGNSADVRQIGVQVKRGNSNYNGFIYMDLFEAQGSGPSQAMLDRNRIYGDWYDQADLLDADGFGFWLLSGHQDDGTLYPDYDQYTVYHPEDSATAGVIQDYSSRAAAKSGATLQALWDDCEAIGNWNPANGYSDATAVSLNSSFVTQGSYAIQAAYTPAGFNKAYLEKSGLDEDWSAKTTFRFDIYNPGGPTSATVAVSTGSNWDWHESISFPLAVGWNTITTGLSANNWKSAATGWQNNGTIANRSQVKRLAIGIFGYGSAGSIHVDNIRLY